MARQMITCESCGKRYDYLKTEACPNCGAFNYIKDGQQHLCGAEDVENIIEMKSAEHGGEDEPRRADTQIDRGLARKFASARKQLDRLETSEDVFRSSMGSKSTRQSRSYSTTARSSRSDRSDRYDRQATVNQSGCLKAIGIVVAIVVVLNLFGGLIAAGVSVLIPEPEPSPSYPTEPEPDSYISEIYSGMPGASYTFHDLTFTVLDSAILDTGDALDDGQLLLGVNLEASCDLPDGEYTPVRAYPYLTDADYNNYYDILDVVSPIDEDLVERAVGNASPYLLQDFEISDLDGGETVQGYMPFLVDAESAEELQLNLQMDCYNTDTGEYESICYVFELDNLGKLSLEDAANAYYNSAY